MEKNDKLALTSPNVLLLFKGAVSRGDETTTAEMLEELLERGAELKNIVDFVYSKVESGHLKMDGKMATIIANTILKKTVIPVLSVGVVSTSLYRHYYALREFAETISNASDPAEIVSWYGNKTSINNLLEITYASDR